MPISFNINRKIGLLYTLFYDKVNAADAFRYAEQVNTHREIKYARKTLVYLKESRLEFKIEEVEDFAYFLVSNKNFRFREKIALLINSPVDTVAATIYAQTLLTNNPKINVELFYTLDAALQFLDLPDKKEEVLETMRAYSTSNT